MKIFGINITTKKDLNKRIQELEDTLRYEKSKNEDLTTKYNKVLNTYGEMIKTYPLTLGDIVYDIQLRDENGRYTRTKASRAQSLINEVVVDTKNYFKLIDRYQNNDVFLCKANAEEYLNEVCIK